LQLSPSGERRRERPAASPPGSSSAQQHGRGADAGRADALSAPENQAEAGAGDDLTGFAGSSGLLDVLHAAEEVGGMLRVGIEHTEQLEQHAALGGGGVAHGLDGVNHFVEVALVEVFAAAARGQDEVIDAAARAGPCLRFRERLPCERQSWNQQDWLTW
jgi:hypothetical protein